MKVLVFLLFTAFIALTYYGCTPAKAVLAQNVALYQKGEFEQAHKGMAPLLEKTSNETLPLFQLTDATMLFTMGNAYAGCPLMFKAASNMEVSLGTGTVALDLLGSEENTHYRGSVHERVLARFYLGIGYFQQGYYDSAKIAFLQANERDINKENDSKETFSSVHFMLGETMLRLREFDNATVAFRNVTRLAPSFPYGWYKLAYTLNKKGSTEEANQAYEQYKKLADPNALLPIDGSGSYIFVLLDLGWGPTLSPDAFTGAFASYQAVSYPEKYAAITVDKSVAKTVTVENIAAQADSEANFAGDVTRKVASVAVKQIAKQIPVLGLFAGSTDADVRKWLLLPGEIQIGLVPATPGIHDITLQFYNKENTELKDYQQSWYYIPSAPEGKAPILHIRSLFQLQNQLPKEK